jgi:hypothetical protein
MQDVPIRKENLLVRGDFGHRLTNENMETAGFHPKWCFFARFDATIRDVFFSNGKVVYTVFCNGLLPGIPSLTNFLVPMDPT